MYFAPDVRASMSPLRVKSATSSSAKRGGKAREKRTCAEVDEAVEVADARLEVRVELLSIHVHHRPLTPHYHWL